MDTQLYIGGLILNVILCYGLGLIGRKRGLGFGTSFFISLFFSPIIGGLYVLLSKKSSAEEQNTALETQKQRAMALNDTKK